MLGQCLVVIVLQQEARGALTALVVGLFLGLTLLLAALFAGSLLARRVD